MGAEILVDSLPTPGTIAERFIKTISVKRIKWGRKSYNLQLAPWPTCSATWNGEQQSPWLIGLFICTNVYAWSTPWLVYLMTGISTITITLGLTLLTIILALFKCCYLQKGSRRKGFREVPGLVTAVVWSAPTVVYRDIYEGDSTGIQFLHCDYNVELCRALGKAVIS